MRVAANFSSMADLQSGMAQASSGIGTENDYWVSQVLALQEVWPDSNGQDFGLLSKYATDFNMINNDFLALLGVKVGQANEYHQAAYRAAGSAINGGGTGAPGGASV